MGTIKLGPVLVCAALVIGAISAKASTITYAVSVDTSSVVGTSGFLDFQFNPGNNMSVAATATISGFNSGGGTLGSPSITGDVTGSLPGNVTFINDQALNELFQGFTYGSNFSFFLTLSGPAVGVANPGETAGTEFGLGLYDMSQSPILTNQNATTGFAATIDVNPDGTETVTTFPPGRGGPPVTTITELVTPEPGTLLLLLAGLSGVLGLRRLSAAAHTDC